MSIFQLFRVLRDKDGISKNLKERLLSVSKSINYFPNEFAANLRKKKSKVIGLIIPKIINFFIPDLLEGMIEFAEKKGYKVMVFSSEENFEK